MPAKNQAIQIKFHSYFQLIGYGDRVAKLENFKNFVDDMVELWAAERVEKADAIDACYEMAQAYSEELEPAGTAAIISAKFEAPPRLVKTKDFQPWAYASFVPSTEEMFRFWQMDVREREAPDWRFVGGQWLIYENGVWLEDETGARLACHVAAFLRKVGRPHKDRASKKLKIESIAMQGAIIRRAEQELFIAADKFDANNNLIAFPSNCCDVATDAFIAHRKEHYVSRCCAVDPIDMPTPTWDAALAQGVPDEATREYLYRYWGYCLGGWTKEQCFLFLQGPGQAGKSTLLETIQAIMGTYADTGSVGFLTRAAHERHPEELAALRGKRFLFCDEMDKNLNWDEAKLKQIVSSERVRARFMHKNSFTYTPHFKIAVSGNTKPGIDDPGKSMARRIHLVEFKSEIRDEDKDTNIKDKLKPEWGGIMFKVLQGARQWWREGLGAPTPVLEATAEYIAEEDLIKQWLEERKIVCYVKDAQGRLTNQIDGTRFAAINDLDADWADWCQKSGERRISKSKLTRELKARGYRFHRTTKERGFKGLYVALTAEQREQERKHRQAYGSDRLV